MFPLEKSLSVGKRSTLRYGENQIKLAVYPQQQVRMALVSLIMKSSITSQDMKRENWSTGNVSEMSYRVTKAMKMFAAQILSTVQQIMSVNVETVLFCMHLVAVNIENYIVCVTSVDLPEAIPLQSVLCV